MKIFINLAVFAVLLVTVGVLYSKWGRNLARPVAAAVTSVPLDEPAQKMAGAAGVDANAPAAPPPAGDSAAPTSPPASEGANASPSVPDEKMLLVAIEGRLNRDSAYQHTGTGFFAKLQSRIVLVTSGAALTGYAELRVILADGTKLPCGKLAARNDRDLLVMELGGRSMPHVLWPDTVLPLARGTPVEIRSLSFVGGIAQQSTLSGVILSEENGFYMLSETPAEPGSIVLTTDQRLVGVISRDPRASSQATIPTEQESADYKRPITFRTVVTALATPASSALDWNTKSTENIVLDELRLRDVPIRSPLLDILVAAYPALVTEGDTLSVTEFYQLARDYKVRYAEADEYYRVTGDVRRVLQTQLEYGRQLEARLGSDVSAVRSGNPIALHAWMTDEYTRRRKPLREKLTKALRAVEILLNAADN